MAAALLLAGCSGPASVAERVERGLPTSLTEAQRSAVPWEQTSVLGLEDGSRFALITWGSSSCPTVVSTMEAVGTEGIEGIEGIELHLESSGGSGPCTADMAATTHELSFPDSVTARPITLTLVHAESDATSTLTLD